MSISEMWDSGKAYNQGKCSNTPVWQGDEGDQEGSVEKPYPRLSQCKRNYYEPSVNRVIQKQEYDERERTNWEGY